MENKISFKNSKQIGDIVLFMEPKPITEGQIIEINHEAELIKVIKKGEGPISERIKWYPSNEFPFPRREYKIINLTEFPDMSTGKNLLVAELAHVQKTFQVNDNSVTCFDTFSLSNLDTFILPMESRYANDFINNPDNNKIICHTLYYKERDFIMDNEVISASYLLPGFN
jgi:hypothetical protein